MDYEEKAWREALAAKWGKVERLVPLIDDGQLRGWRIITRSGVTIDACVRSPTEAEMTVTDTTGKVVARHDVDILDTEEAITQALVLRWNEP